MPLVLADRVVERSDTKGLANFTLQGTSTGYQAFSAVGNGSTVYYTIEGVYDDGTLTGEWEVGVGVYNAGILSRDTILSSSTGSKVSFTAGQKNVFIDLPSEKAVVLDDTDKVSGYAITGGSINNTPIGATTASTGRFTSVTTPSVTATTNDLTLSAISTGVVNLNTALGNQVQVSNIGDGTRPLQLNGGLSGTNSGITSFGGMSLSAGSGGGNAISFYSNGRNTTEQARVSHTASAVNYVQVTGAATGNSPVISMQGSDANITAVYRSKGTGAHIFQNSSGQWLLRTSNPTGTLVNYPMTVPSVSGSASGLQVEGSDTNIDLSLTTKGTGAINVNSGNGTIAKFIDNGAGFSLANFVSIQGRNAGAPPRVWVDGSDTNVNMSVSSKGTGSIGFWTNSGSTQQFNISNTASAVNYVQVTGASTGNGVTISAQGSDANIGLNFLTKGTFNYTFNTSGGIQFGIAHTASAVNYVRASGSAAGSAPSFSSFGSDTNIDLALTPKGTGLVRFGTYTNTVSTIAGYIQIRDAGGTIRRLAVVS
jgi:hypothetical protein